jgi:L-threonylcarbamoyladenylate synthase
MIQEVKQVVEVLRKGGVVLYPTDTVWGLGCDATNEEAVKRIYDIKQRADNKAMLVLLDSTAKLQGYVVDIPDLAYDLIDMSTKPLTIIY